MPAINYYSISDSVLCPSPPGPMQHESMHFLFSLQTRFLLLFIISMEYFECQFVVLNFPYHALVENSGKSGSILPVGLWSGSSVAWIYIYLFPNPISATIYHLNGIFRVPIRSLEFSISCSCRKSGKIRIDPADWALICSHFMWEICHAALWSTPLGPLNIGCGGRYDTFLIWNRAGIPELSILPTRDGWAFIAHSSHQLIGLNNGHNYWAAIRLFPIIHGQLIGWISSSVGKLSPAQNVYEDVNEKSGWNPNRWRRHAIRPTSFQLHFHHSNLEIQSNNIK